MQVMGQSMKTALGPRFKPVRDEAGNIMAQIEQGSGRAFTDPRAVGGAGGLASAKTEILADGTTIQALPSGAVQVRNPAGDIVGGQDRLKVLKAAQQNEIRQASVKAGSKKAAVSAINQSNKAIEGLGKIKTSVLNIDRAIEAIDQGAGTGPLRSFLPSIKTSSVALDNVQGQLGLDVIATTTFGALSESELAFALSTALPTKMRPKELRKWLIKKKATQEKLGNYLENAAIFLGVPGNTPALWVKEQRRIQDEEDVRQESSKVPLEDLLNQFRSK